MGFSVCGSLKGLIKADPKCKLELLSWDSYSWVLPWCWHSWRSPGAGAHPPCWSPSFPQPSRRPRTQATTRSTPTWTRSSGVCRLSDSDFRNSRCNRPSHVTPARHKHLDFLNLYNVSNDTNVVYLFLHQLFKKLNRGSKQRLRDTDGRGKGRCH